MMGESRQELLAWINDLLHLGYTKIEQFGSGAAHCQIIDSIYGDLPLSKVKFNAKHEYEYVANFKVLQSAFDRHNIDNHIPVDRLIKSKFQDNLEFLQLMKKIWDGRYPGGHYDAIARRKGAPVGSASNSSSSLNRGSNSSLKKTASAGVVSKTASRTNVSSTLASSSAVWEKEKQELVSEYQRMLADASQQAVEFKLTYEQVVKEREFYYSKLREIEDYITTTLESRKKPEIDVALNYIQSVMYKTEEGFEAPEETEESPEQLEMAELKV